MHAWKGGGIDKEANNQNVPSLVMPALFTRMDTGSLKAAAVSLNRASTSAGLDISA